MMIRRSFKFRLRPNPEQESRLREWERSLKTIWNAALEQRFTVMRHWRQGCSPDFLGYLQQQNQLTEARAASQWLNDVPCACCQGVLRDLDKAWQGWLRARNSGRPRFKGRHHSVAIFASAPSVGFIDGAVKFPKVGPIKAVIHRPIEGTIKTAAITRDIDEWYVSFSCEHEVRDPGASELPVVGVDRGVAVTLADSFGRVSCIPDGIRELTERAAHLQATLLAHKRKGSKSRERAKDRIAAVSRHARRIREDWLHNEALYYATHYGVIKVEALKIRNMTRSAAGTTEEPGVNVAAKAGLNRSILEQGWARFVEILKYKCEATGAVVVEVPAAYTSQTCSECGCVDVASRRSQSEFSCVHCGFECNADVNAAKNISARDGRVIGGYNAKAAPKQKRRILKRVKGTTTSKLAGAETVAS